MAQYIEEIVEDIAQSVEADADATDADDVDNAGINNETNAGINNDTYANSTNDSLNANPDIDINDINTEQTEDTNHTDDIYSHLEQHALMFFERIIHKLVEDGLVDFKKGKVYFPRRDAGAKINVFPINEYFYSIAFPIIDAQQSKIRRFSKDTKGGINKKFKPLEAMFRSGATNLGIFPDKWGQRMVFTTDELKSWLFLDEEDALYKKIVSKYKISKSEYRRYKHNHIRNSQRRNSLRTKKPHDVNDDIESMLLISGVDLANIYHKLLDYLFVKEEEKFDFPVFYKSEEFVESGEAYMRLTINLTQILRKSGIEKRYLITQRLINSLGASSEEEETDICRGKQTDISSIALLLLPTYSTITTHKRSNSRVVYTYNTNGNLYRTTDLEEMVVHIASLHCFDYKMNIPVNIVYYGEKIEKYSKGEKEDSKEEASGTIEGIEEVEGVEEVADAEDEYGVHECFLINPANEEPVHLDELDRNRFILLNLALFPIEGDLITKDRRIIGATGKLKMLYDIAKASLPDGLNHRNIPLYLKQQFLPAVDLL